MIFPFLNVGELALASYIGMGVQSLSSGIGGLFTNKAIKKENQKNRDWNEKMWNLTNEYNSPVNQRRLYEQAGLNPALLYNSGTSALSSYAGNLSTSENFKNPGEGVRLDVAQGIQLEQSQRQLESNIAVNDSVIRKNDADTANVDASTALLKSQTYEQDIKNKYAEQEKIIDLAKKGFDKEAAELAVKFARESNPLEIQRLIENINNLKADNAIKVNTANLITEQINTQREETNLVKAKQGTERATQSMLKKQGDYYTQLALSEPVRRDLMRAQETHEYTSALVDMSVKDLNKALEQKTYAEKQYIIRQAALTPYQMREIQSRTHLNEAQIMDIFNGIEQSILNGNVDRYVRTVSQRYGTGSIGVMMSYLYENCYLLSGGSLPQVISH